MIYRVTYAQEDSPSGYVAKWFETLEEANKCALEHGVDVTSHQVRRTKAQLVQFLNIYADCA